MKKIIFALIFVIALSCSTDSETDSLVDFTEQNEQEIQDYIQDNNLNAQRSATGLYYVIDEPGSGERPNSNSNVTVSYRGFFTDGTVFDESDANGVSFDLQQVIPGWTEGIQLFGEGGSGTLLVPSRLGYGNRDFRGIPAGSVLIFEVILISVN
ncbi:FKBP-type peptidyl-prolyl cis-trans isomerase [Costertonia aggregata]|uniref:Peptidyl-prolyl cis-trans isomerase n=1 Tax=Costertonia aggregata TaxID=343403 RepID=A0A7H9AML3_9FLAO|nr:FKBP-type peptidyl-prolyl cis-trans isomerase [Costertonia aggregata]QLG44678.1 FKBP-type peptidyl-prolyl cis-trans isomerase [Costertonia aggregata]